MKKLREIMMDAVLERLKHFNGNKSKTAESLGVSLRTIRIWAGKYPVLSEYKCESNDSLWTEFLTYRSRKIKEGISNGIKIQPLRRNQATRRP